MTEEQKAAAYRLAETTKERARLANYKALYGSRAAYKALVAKTEALRHNAGWDPSVRLDEDERRVLAN